MQSLSGRGLHFERLSMNQCLISNGFDCQSVDELTELEMMPIYSIRSLSLLRNNDHLKRLKISSCHFIEIYPHEMECVLSGLQIFEILIDRETVQNDSFWILIDNLTMPHLETLNVEIKGRGGC